MAGWCRSAIGDSQQESDRSDRPVAAVRIAGRIPHEIVLRALLGARNGGGISCLVFGTVHVPDPNSKPIFEDARLEPPRFEITGRRCSRRGDRKVGDGVAGAAGVLLERCTRALREQYVSELLPKLCRSALRGPRVRVEGNKAADGPGALRGPAGRRRGDMGACCGAGASRPASLTCSGWVGRVALRISIAKVGF